MELPFDHLFHVWATGAQVVRQLRWHRFGELSRLRTVEQKVEHALVPSPSESPQKPFGLTE